MVPLKRYIGYFAIILAAITAFNLLSTRNEGADTLSVVFGSSVIVFLVSAGCLLLSKVPGAFRTMLRWLVGISLIAVIVCLVPFMLLQP